MTRKSKVTLSAQQKLEYAKLMVEEGYTNKQIEEISGAGKSAVSRWKQQYLSELDGKSPENVQALTTEQQRIQSLEKQLQRALSSNSRSTQLNLPNQPIQHFLRKNNQYLTNFPERQARIELHQ